MFKNLDCRVNIYSEKYLDSRKKEEKVMKQTSKENRLETLKDNGFNVENFFDLSMRVPLGAEVKIIVNGKEMIVNGCETGVANKNECDDKKSIDFKTVSESRLNAAYPILASDSPEAIYNKYYISKPSGLNTRYDFDRKIAKEFDPIEQGIYSSGYVKNTRLFRRWIAAQTFWMINYTHYNNKNRKGWEACMKDCYDYNYQFKMILEEIRVLAILEKEDKEAFNERKIFFNEDVVVELVKNYLYRLKKYIKTQRQKHTRKCNGEEYVSLKKYGFVYVSDLDEKVYDKIAEYIKFLECDAKNIKSGTSDYKVLYKSLSGFIKYRYNKLPYETPKCAEWKDAFKAAGAFYTLQNTIRFTGMLLPYCDDKYESEELLYKLLKEYKGEEWRLHRVLLEAIEYNKYDFKERISNPVKYNM